MRNCESCSATKLCHVLSDITIPKINVIPRFVYCQGITMKISYSNSPSTNISLLPINWQEKSTKLNPDVSLMLAYNAPPRVSHQCSATMNYRPLLHKTKRCKMRNFYIGSYSLDSLFRL